MRDEGTGKRRQILEHYKGLMEAVDQKTAEVYSGSPEIPCKNKCYDCCKQLFPISFAEAFHISDGLKTLGRKLRRDRERVAQKITKKILEQNPLQFEKQGVEKIAALRTHSEFARFLHAIESDCPALDQNVTLSPPEDCGLPAGRHGSSKGGCTVYPFRNHDCRTMGASYDGPEKTVVGCFRFSGLKYLVPKLMDFSFRYSEKMQMDRELIAEVTGGMFTSNILYYTTMCGPLVKDYAATDWVKFFSEKNLPAKSKPDEYWVVIDV